MPIASIITLATLTVVSKPTSSNKFTTVPNLDFRTLVFDGSIPAIVGSNNGVYQYAGPNVEAQGIAAAVASLDAILPITPPSVNSSWNIEFDGPALQCSNIDGDQAQSILENIIDYTSSNCATPLGFIAWSQVPAGDNISMPFVSASGNRSLQLNVALSNSGYDDEGAENLTDATNSNASLCLAVLPQMVGETDMATHTISIACETWQYGGTNPNTTGLVGNATVLRCDLRNATHNVAYNFTNSNQQMNANMTYIQPSDTVRRVAAVYGPGLLGGTTHWCDTRLALGAEAANCTLDDSLLTRLSYQAIMDAFSDLIEGTLTMDQAGTGFVADGTSILSTSLLSTKEL
jgi:hypothetical protein